MINNKPIAAALLGVLLTVAASAQSPEGEPVKVYAAAAVKTSLSTIAAAHERATGEQLTVVFDSAGATLTRFLADPEASLLVTTPAQIERAQADGKLSEGITIVLGSTVAGVAAPPGSPMPDVSTPEKLRAALLAADRVAFSDPSRGATVGTHFMKVIESLGVKDEVLAKAALAPNGIETMRLVLEEGVDIGITQTSEILQANRAALAGAFPKEFELATAYALWHRRDISAAAAAFAAAILSPEGRSELAAEGLAPPAER